MTSPDNQSVSHRQKFVRAEAKKHVIHPIDVVELPHLGVGTIKVKHKKMKADLFL